MRCTSEVQAATVEPKPMQELCQAWATWLQLRCSEEECDHRDKPWDLYDEMLYCYNYEREERYVREDEKRKRETDNSKVWELSAVCIGTFVL